MSNIVAVKSSTDVNTQSDTKIMMNVFGDICENHPKRLEDRELTSFQLRRRYKSLHYISLMSISAGEVPQSTTALMNQVFSNLRGKLSYSCGNYCPQEFFWSKSDANRWLIMAFKTNSIGYALETIQSIPSKEMQFLTNLSSEKSTNSEIMATVATGISNIETVVSSTLPPSANGSKKRPDHQMTGLQDMLTRNGYGDATGMDTTVTAVSPKRRSLWNQRFAWRMVCSGSID
ncbi:hypothetical protein QTP88_003270 [Uroleucon formosanum]